MIESNPQQDARTTNLNIWDAPLGRVFGKNSHGNILSMITY